MKGARESGILSTFVPDPQGSGYMLAFPMDESGAVGAESAPVAEVAAPPEGPTSTTTTEASANEDNKETEGKDAAGNEQIVPVVVVPSPSPFPVQQNNGPITKEQIDVERRRKMEEMRKILGLPPTLPFKPKPIPQDKPKPSFPSLFKILPKFQSPLEILTRRSDDGSPRFAVISDIIQAASSFMRRALIEEEVNTLQDISKGNEKDKDDKDDKDDMMFLLDDDDKTKDKNSEPDLEDLISLLPLAAARPMPIPFPFRPIRRMPPRLPFGLPRPPMFSPRRQIIAVDPRRVSGPRMIPFEVAQSMLRPVPVPQQFPVFPIHQGPFGHQGPYGHPGPYGHQGPYGPQGPYGHMGPVFPLPSHSAPQIVPIFQVPEPRMSRMMHPQQVPFQQFQMHPEPMMHRPQYPHPMQPVMVMLHPTIVPHFVPRPVYVHEPHPVPFPVPVQEMESQEQQQQEGNEGPVMALVEDQRGGRSLPFFPRPSLSPLQKVQIIRELLMARQSSFPIFPFGRPNRTPVPHFHPPVPQQKRPEPREEKSSGSFLRPIFLPL